MRSRMKVEEAMCMTVIYLARGVNSMAYFINTASSRLIVMLKSISYFICFRDI